MASAIARRSSHQTQWAAQFAVASELCKRGYEVALTMGNHPTRDLMVTSPGSVSFGIDVKGLYKPNFWWVRPKPDRVDIFYVFALVPEDAPNRFFILSQAQVNEGIRADSDRARQAAINKGRSVDEVRDFPGMAWGFARPFEDRWDQLPR